jgi:hypothetical protein
MKKKRSKPAKEQPGIATLDDATLLRLSLAPGRIGINAFLALSARSIAKRKFSLK